MDLEEPEVEDASEDEWSVVEDDKAKAAPTADAPIVHVHGSEPCQGFSLSNSKEEEADQSLASTEPLSPVLLAKWDTELHQLHELGFLDDRKNVDVLETLEAAHIGVGSDEKVTIDAAIGRLLGERH